MNPRLVIVSGKGAGAIYPVTEEGVWIGRDEGADLCIERDRQVSPLHCRIYQRGGNTILSDCSRKGTFVNGHFFPLKFLVHGDRIRTGRTKFAYLEEDEVDSRLARLIKRFKEEKVEAARYHGRGEEFAATDRTILAAFMEINTSISKIRDIDEIQAQIAELIFRVFPAERVAILLTGQDQKRFASRFFRHIGSDAGDPFPIDEAYALRILHDGELVFGNGEPTLCRRIDVLDAAVGVIYIELNGPNYLSALDFHRKLLRSIASFAAVALEHARYVQWLEGENQRLNEAVQSSYGMIGRSEKMQRLNQFIARAGPSDLSVLITGSSGSGKELMARGLHRESPRAHAKFFAVNCAAIPESLLESELFGHEKSAFTGAHTQRKGIFEDADGGTVFLDEIGEMPPPMQAKLLRALQEGEVKRLGGNKTIKVDVRIIAATNRDLRQQIQEKRFREDLFFRLNVLTVEMPSLADRRDDIPLLAAHFIQKYGARRTRLGLPAVLGLKPEAVEVLMRYRWPGNIRELEHAIEHAISLGTTKYILPKDLPEQINREIALDGDIPTYADAKKEMQKSLFAQTLAKLDWKYPEAAKRLGMNENYLRDLCKSLGIRKPDSRFF